MNVLEDWDNLFNKTEGETREPLDLMSYIYRRDMKNITVTEELLYKSKYAEYLEGIKNSEQKAISFYQEKYWPLLEETVVPLINEASDLDQIVAFNPEGGDPKITLRVFQFNLDLHSIKIRSEIIQLTNALRQDATVLYQESLEELTKGILE